MSMTRIYRDETRCRMGASLFAVLLVAVSLRVQASDGSPEVPDWLQTARVFLIDAYYPPMAPEMEFDAQALAETMEAMNVNTVRMATMGKYATIQGVRFTRHRDQGDRDLLAEMIAACKPRNIRVVPYISTGHKLAWSMVTEDYPEYAQRTRPDGGPQHSHMFVGEDHGTICWNTPYRQAFMDLVEHVVRDYDVAGVYFDTWRPHYFWPGMKVCYCGGCKKGFQEATGQMLPWREDSKDYTARELALIERYHQWYADVLAEILHEVRRLVKSHKDIPLIYNINNPQKITAEDPRIIEAMDAFLYERGRTMLERVEGISLARSMGMHIWPYVGTYGNWPRAIYDGYNYQQQIFTSTMFTGAPIMAQPHAYVNHPQYRRYVTYPFGVLAANEHNLAGFENYPYVAVVYGYQDPPGFGRKANWDRKVDARSATLGAFAACLYGHVQVSSVHETILDQPERLGRYKVLYLAGAPRLSKSRIENIKRFVGAGGGLVTSYAASLYDAEARRRERFALEELTRVVPMKPRGEVARIMRSYVVMVGGPSDLYMLARPGAEAFDGYWANRLVPLWFYEPVKVLEGGSVAMDIVTGDGRRAFLPGVVLSRYGKGRVAYMASCLESLFQTDNMDVLGKLIRTLVKTVAPEPAPYELQAPAGLLCNMTVNGNRRVLHMTNWTGNKFERMLTKEYYLAPVEDVVLRVRLPENERIRSVGTFVVGPSKRRDLDGAVEITFPRIEAYQAVHLELE
ncbi:MAG: hypothetical protein ISS70_20330 [Phycisphaerae bacterium]|nr:hypothetical protein [Phycisphaerae bacterium]